MSRIAGGVLAARGFRAAGVSAGLKTRAGALDVGLIVSDAPAAAAGCFTTNRVASAPVQYDRRAIRRGSARVVLVNSGNANACTGQRGLEDARACVARAALCLGLKSSEVLVASTGIIGHPLPMAKLLAGVDAAASALGRGPAHAKAIARAIMTTDTRPKSAALRIRLDGAVVTVGGIAKGAGMISPYMATMLSFITTDAAVVAPLLQDTLRDVVGRTYNRLTVDGDTSTNDSVFLLANGASGAPAITARGRSLDLFRDALEAVAQDLVRQIARDGEGATRLLIVTVRNARNEADADRVARAIANSPLVKCAVHGGDPNWGRIICAAGYSGAPVRPERMRLRIGGETVFLAGVPTSAPAGRLRKAMTSDPVVLDLDLGQGKASATMWTCDFSHEYVTINAQYHT